MLVVCHVGSCPSRLAADAPQLLQEHWSQHILVEVGGVCLFEPSGIRHLVRAVACELCRCSCVIMLSIAALQGFFEASGRGT